MNLLSEHHITFLKGKKTLLRPLDRTKDMDYCLQWINDPDITPFVRRFMPVSREEEQEWFDRHAHHKDAVTFMIETHKGKPIGVMGIDRIDWKDRVGTTGAIIGDKRYWGKGYGTDAKMILLNFAFNALNLRKMCSHVIAYNKRSLYYSLHCGYKIEGRLRAHHFKEGAYHDGIVLGLLKEEWLPYWKRYQKNRR